MNLTNSKISWRLTQSSIGFCLDHLLVIMLFGVAFYIFKSQSFSDDEALGIIIYLKVCFSICSPVWFGNSLFLRLFIAQLEQKNWSHWTCRYFTVAFWTGLLHPRFWGISICFYMWLFSPANNKECRKKPTNSFSVRYLQLKHVKWQQFTDFWLSQYCTNQVTLVLQFGCDCSDPNPGQFNCFHQKPRLYFFTF